MSQVSNSLLLSPADYTSGNYNWKSIVNDNPTALANLFKKGDNRLGSAIFTIEQIGQLISAVGARHICARFVALNSPADPQFCIVLYAIDSQGYRLSAYYKSQELLPVSNIHAPVTNSQVVKTLATTWISTWASCDKIKKEMFDTHYGPLSGYRYDIDDFLQPLFDITESEWGKSKLQIDFCLHYYYTPEQGEEEGLKYTFGIVNQLVPDAPDGSSGKQFFDMTMPCPPICGDME
jgi:hypothetical protein